MTESCSQQTQEEFTPDWFKEFALLLTKKNDPNRIRQAKKVFVETYFDNIREGMNQKDAVQKAKTLAMCFLIIQR